MIEMLHTAEVVRSCWTIRTSWPGSAGAGQRSGEGVGIIEAPAAR
jgi:hypothetical protein